jgi:2'-hydroxyisoflavone reductase
MRVLVIGGTRFLGRQVTEAALAAGHDVTVLHRGHTGAELFPEATHLLADRDGDLSILDGHDFEATIDPSGYHPDQVHRLADALGGRGGHYTFVSSVSVYARPEGPGFTEDSRLLELEGPLDAPVVSSNYGAMKALCERAARADFGENSLILRPCYIVGPHDYTARFTYWVHRIARGGTVLAPGRPDYTIQVIDVRDLAAFMVDRIGNRIFEGGTFHTVSPSMTFQELLDRVAVAVAPPGTEIVWAADDFLREHGESNRTIPLWTLGNPDYFLIGAADPSAVEAAGLRLRPLADTFRDTLAAEPEPSFLSAEREAELLKLWAAR